MNDYAYVCVRVCICTYMSVCHTFSMYVWTYVHMNVSLVLYQLKICCLSPSASTTILI